MKPTLVGTALVLALAGLSPALAQQADGPEETAPSLQLQATGSDAVPVPRQGAMQGQGGAYDHLMKGDGCADPAAPSV